MGKKDYDIRCYGIPYGFESNSFIENVINVANGSSNLSEDTKEKLQCIEEPVNIQVFVTLACPHCPAAASLAHKFAMESEKVQADVIDVSEFPHLGQKYSAIGAPKIVINEPFNSSGRFQKSSSLLT